MGTRAGVVKMSRAAVVRTVSTKKEGTWYGVSGRYY